MSTPQIVGLATSSEPETISRLLKQFECGPIEFAGTANAFYERHLVFDNVVDPAAVGPRERFEAVWRVPCGISCRSDG